jgi:hypothetical protein
MIQVHRFLKEHTNMKNTSTDLGGKPEKVYKYDDQDGFSDSDSSQARIICLSGMCYQRHPTSRCT